MTVPEFENGADDNGLDEWFAAYLEAEEAAEADPTALGEPVYGPAANDPAANGLAANDPARALCVAAHRRLARLAAPLRAALDPWRRALAAREPSVQNDPLPRPFGAFELLAALGAGGMGTVYQARQHRPERLVALKIMRADARFDGAETRRFLNEAEWVARLDHAGIVPIFEVGVVDDRPFLCMKLMEGGDLGRQLERFGDPRAAAALVAQVARVVHHAHQRGVLHRDLKPSNILLDAHGKPHVADFGLARALATSTAGDLTSLTLAGALVGTPAYMAPEQVFAASGKLATTAVDVYGLGGVLYALLTGRPPFRGDSALETLHLVATTEPTPPRRLGRRVDRDLDTICLKCLARAPHDRYGSAEAVADDLERWLAGESILARPPSPWERAWRFCRRQPVVSTLAAAVAALTLFLVAGLLAAVLVLREAEAQTREQQRRAQRQAELARSRETEARRLLYAGDVDRAWRAFEASDTAFMEELLRRHVPREDQEETRGFEWRYLNHLARGVDQVETFPLRRSAVFGLTFAPGGERFAAASADRVVAMHSARDRRLLFELGGFLDDANWIEFTPDGRTLLAAGEDGSIWSCDAAAGRDPVKLYQTAGPAPIPQIALHPQGNLLAAACWDGAVRCFDYPSMRPAPSPENAHAFKAECVRFTPDGATLISGGRDGALKMWDARTGAPRHVFPGLGEIKSLAMARGRPWVAAGSYDGSVRVFDHDQGRLARRLAGPNFRVLAVAISPDDAWLAAAEGNGRLWIWSLDSGALWDVWPVSRQIVWSLTFSPDSRYLWFGDHAGHVGRRLLDKPRLRRRLLPVDDAWKAAQPTPGGREIVCVSSTRPCVALVDVASEQTRYEQFEFAPWSEPLCFAANDEWRAIGFRGRRLALWRRGESAPRWTAIPPQADAKYVALLDSRRSLLTCDSFEHPRQWSLATGAAQGFFHSAETTLLTFGVSPDGALVALAYANGDLAVAPVDNPAAAKRLSPAGEHSAELLAFSSDNAWLAAANPANIRVYRRRPNGDYEQTALIHARGARGLAFSPDAATLAAATGQDGVRLIHLATGQETFVLHGADNFDAVVFAPDGQKLFATGRASDGAGTLFVWDAPAGRERKVSGP